MATKRPLALYDGEIEEIRTGDTIPATIAPGSGGAGSQQLFVQQVRPTEPGPWQWWKTNAQGQIINLIVNDGA